MLVIKIEFWPLGDKSKAQEIASGRIFNDGSGTEEVGNYVVSLREEKKRYKESRVEGFKRLKRGPWELLFLALKNVFEPESIETPVVVHNGIEGSNGAR